MQQLLRIIFFMSVILFDTGTWLCCKESRWMVIIQLIMLYVSWNAARLATIIFMLFVSRKEHKMHVQYRKHHAKQCYTTSDLYISLNLLNQLINKCTWAYGLHVLPVAFSQHCCGGRIYTPTLCRTALKRQEAAVIIEHWLQGHRFGEQLPLSDAPRGWNRSK